MINRQGVDRRVGRHVPGCIAQVGIRQAGDHLPVGSRYRRRAGVILTRCQRANEATIKRQQLSPNA